MTIDERLAPVLAAVERHCILPETDECTKWRAAVRDAIVALMVGELEAAIADGASGRTGYCSSLQARLAEWRAARDTETPAG